MNKTQAEILARFNELGADDYFGFRREALLEAMDFDTAMSAGLVGSDTSAAEWGAPDVKGTASAYLEFAIGKAAGHRGISASRSIEKLGEWVWCLGDAELDERFVDAPYPSYGAPKLELLAQAWGVAHPARETEEWRRMAAGELCSPGCGGCAS